MKKIAINGFGRIGRLVFKILENEANDLQVVAINDLTNADTLAHLLKFDSVYGKFNKEVKVKDASTLLVDGREIKIFAEMNPANLPWGEMDIDLVVESTGKFVELDKAQTHIDAGAKKVLISAPGKGEMKSVVFNVNHEEISSEDKIVSAASCTTNCLAPIVKVLEDEFKIKKGFMTTIHAYTGDQPTLDRPHKDLRRARSAAVNFIPTTTGATTALGKVIPSVAGKISGMAVRGPVQVGSLIDLVVELEDNTASVDSINQAIKKASSESLGYSDEPIVSSDVIGDTRGTIFDSLLTDEVSVDGSKLFKVVSWYDNEHSYASQYVRVLKYMINL